MRFYLKIKAEHHIHIFVYNSVSYQDLKWNSPYIMFMIESYYHGIKNMLQFLLRPQLGIQ